MNPNASIDVRRRGHGWDSRSHTRGSQMWFHEDARLGLESLGPRDRVQRLQRSRATKAREFADTVLCLAREFSFVENSSEPTNFPDGPFFSVLGHAGFDPDWEHLGQREFDPLLDYITDLPTPQAGELDQELQAVYELSCQSGMTAIAEAAKLHDLAELPLQMPQEMSVHGRAMWTRLRHPKVFETALMLHEIDHLSWWRKRNDLPSTTPNTSPEAIEALEHAISSLLKDQGRGRLCTVETYTRDNVHYFFAYPDDYSETANQHDDDGNLVPIVINKTMQVVFAYDSREGSLETYAKLPKRMKEGLEGCFTGCILNWKLGEHV